MRDQELKALESVRARMSKYTEALKKKKEAETKQNVVVGSLDEGKKDVSKFVSPVKQQAKLKAKMTIPLQIGSLSSSMLTTFEPKTKEERNAEEQEAKDELTELLDKAMLLTSENDTSLNETKVTAAIDPKNATGSSIKSKQTTNISASNDVSFQSIRVRYLQALEHCKPQQGSKALEKKDKTGPIIKPYIAKRWTRKGEAEKQDQFVKLRGAWDKYELAAQDKPRIDSKEEAEIREQIYNAEDEVVNKWVDYANNVVQEVMNKESGDTEGDDDEEEDDDLAYWIKHAKRMKAEADARRRMKEEALRRQMQEQDEEEEYWMQEAMMLRELNKNKKKDRKKSSESSGIHEAGDDDDGNLINPYDDNVDVFAVAAATRKAKEVLHGSPFSGKSKLFSSTSKLPLADTDVVPASVVKSRMASYSGGLRSVSPPAMSGVQGEKRSPQTKPKERMIQHVPSLRETSDLEERGHHDDQPPNDLSSESDNVRTKKQFGTDDDNIKLPKKKKSSHQFADDSEDEDADDTESMKKKQKKKFTQVTDEGSSDGSDDGDAYDGRNKSIDFDNEDMKQHKKKSRQFAVDDDQSEAEKGGTKAKKKFNEGEDKEKERKKKDVSTSLATDDASSDDETHVLKVGHAKKHKDFVDDGIRKDLKKKSVAVGNEDDDDDVEEVRKKKVFELGSDEGDKKKTKKSFGDMDDSSSGDDYVADGKKKSKKTLIGSDDDDSDRGAADKKPVKKIYDRESDYEKKKKKKGFQFANDDSSDDGDNTPSSGIKTNTQPKKKTYLQAIGDDTSDESDTAGAETKPLKKKFDRESSYEKKKKKKDFQLADDGSSNDEGNTPGDTTMTKKPKKKAYLRDTGDDTSDESDTGAAETKPIKKTYDRESSYEKKKKTKDFQFADDDSSEDDGNAPGDTKLTKKLRKKAYDSSDEERVATKKSKKTVGKGDNDSSGSDGDVAEVSNVVMKSKKSKKSFQSADDSSDDDNNIRAHEGEARSKKKKSNDSGSYRQGDKKTKKKSLGMEASESTDEEGEIKKPSKKSFETDKDSSLKKSKKKTMNSDSDSEPKKEKTKKSFQSADDSSDTDDSSNENIMREGETRRKKKNLYDSSFGREDYKKPKKKRLGLDSADSSDSSREDNQNNKLQKIRKSHDATLGDEKQKTKKKKNFETMDNDSSDSDAISGVRKMATKSRKARNISDSDSGDDAKKGKKNLIGMADDSSVDSNNNDPMSIAQPKKKAFDPDVSNHGKKKKKKNVTTIEDSSSYDDTKKRSKNVSASADDDSSDDNVAGGLNRLKRSKKKRRDSDSDSPDDDKIKTKKKLGKSISNDSDRSGGSSSSVSDEENMVRKGTVSKKKSKKKMTNAVESDSESDSVSGPESDPDQDRKNTRRKKTSAGEETKTKVKKKNLTTNTDENSSDSEGRNESVPSKPKKGKSKIQDSYSTRSKGKKVDTVEREQRGSSLYANDSEYEYDTPKSLLTGATANQNKKKGTQLFLLSDSEAEDDECEGIGDTATLNAASVGQTKANLPKKSNKVALSPKKKKKAVGESGTDSGDGMKTKKGKKLPKELANDTNSKDEQDRGGSNAKGKSKDVKPKRKALGKATEEERKKTEKVKKYSLDDDESSESDDSQKKMIASLPSYMKNSNITTYHTDGEASMSDTVATDDESVKIKEQTHRPQVAAVPYRRSSLVEQKTDLLEEKSLHLDGSFWKYTLKDWRNKPKEDIVISGTKIKMEVPAKTDFWRRTKYHFTQDNAPFHSEQWTGDFETLVCVSGGLSALYQKAGIMIRLDDEYWIFVGMEYVDGKVFMSNIVTNKNSDRTLVPLPLNAQTVGVWFCVKCHSGSVETFYSFDAKKWILTRQTLMGEGQVANVGITGASPSDQKLDVTFNYFKCSKGDIVIGHNRMASAAW